MRRLQNRPGFNDDGTVRRKYELDEERGGRGILGLIIGITLANAAILLKNVLFGNDPAKAAQFQTSGVTTDNESTVHTSAPGSDANASWWNESDDGIGQPSAFDEMAARLYGTTSLTSLAASVGSGSFVANNDNTSLFQSKPGHAVILPQEVAVGVNQFVPKLVERQDSAPQKQPSHAADSTGDSGASQSSSTNPASNADDPRRANRAPVVSGPVMLGSLLTSQSIVIALSEFLSHSSDPDGDQLSAIDFTASSGTIKVLDNGFVMLSDVGDATEITLDYAVSDGLAATPQTASLNLLTTIDATIVGSEGNDRLVGTSHGDIIDARGGDDIVVGLGGNDVIYGGSGNDRIVGGDGNDIIHGGDGDDVIFAGAGNDVVYGENGNDVMMGEDGDDVLFGDAGNDTISGGSGADVIDGGTGHDRLDGGAGNDLILGGDGNDVIDGDTGDDVLTGGAGNDVVLGGDGDNTFIATVNDGNDVYKGGSGHNTYNASATKAALFVDLHSGIATSVDVGTDQLEQVQNVVGGTGDDDIIGDQAPNVIDGGAGDDIIDAGGGADQLTGGAGNDIVLGGDGDDTFIVSAGDGDDHFDGGNGSDLLDLSSTSADAMIDLSSGEANSDEIGHDTMQFIENVKSGSGKDIIIDGNGVNVLIGGAGDDTFVFGSVASVGKGHGNRDKILDFEVGDRIDLENISKEFAAVIDNTFGDHGIRQFVLIGLQDKFANPGELKVKYEDSDGHATTILEGNINYDADAEFELEIVGIHQLAVDGYITHSLH